jgi:hypothetical protein|tara:strand:- start:4196 stop:4729 length:534 start_codon:yes stop_codon:yes gene_type:complete
MSKMEPTGLLFKHQGFLWNESWPARLPDKLQTFHAYCQAKRRSDQKYLLRRDFDPLDLPKLMANLQIVEEVEGQKDRQGRRQLRWRLMGTAFNPEFQRRAKGRSLEDVLAPGLYREVVAIYDRMRKDGQPHYLQASQQMTENNLYSYERIICPTLTEQGTLQFIGCWQWNRDFLAHD